MEPILQEGVNHNHVILVIDDDHAVITSLKFTLEVEGFKVQAYSDARELLNEVSLPPFSCLVIDYYQPVMIGLEFVAELRDRRISIPTIRITMLPSQDLRNRAKAAGIRIVEKTLLGNCLLD